MNKISIGKLIFRFKYKLSLTIFLISLESVIKILFPLFVGLAINDLLEGEYNGVIHLGFLGVTSIVIGSIRRFYDTRVYSGIYSEIAPEMIEREHSSGSSTSRISARSHLLVEFVDFLENSMPELIGSILSLVGIAVIIFSLNQNVFYGCIGVLLVIFISYGLSGKYNYNLNSGYNSQLEKQVALIEQRDMEVLRNYFSGLMSWKIKLSDLEVVNYFTIWLSAIALITYTPIAIIGEGELKYGMIFAALMYVFDYIGVVIMFPMYIQIMIRLKEISNRLAT